MDAVIWAKAHGAATHFPFALALAAFGCDAVALALGSRAAARDFAAAGYWAILGAAVAGIGAVASGLVMTRGVLFGHGALRLHHLFAWPAFVGLIAVATWRCIVGIDLPRAVRAIYVAAAGTAAALVSAAAYWGGELILRG